MPGIELMRDLVQTEKLLTEKLAQAKRSAEERLRQAEEQSRCIVNDAEEQMRRETQATEDRMGKEDQKIAAEALDRARAEAERIHDQAAPHIDRAVDFVLSKVLP